MNILITGAAGFVGSRLAKVLLARGDSIVGNGRGPNRAAEAVAVCRSIVELRLLAQFGSALMSAPASRGTA